MYELWMHFPIALICILAVSSAQQMNNVEIFQTGFNCEATTGVKGNEFTISWMIQLLTSSFLSPPEHSWMINHCLHNNLIHFYEV